MSSFQDIPPNMDAPLYRYRIFGLNVASALCLLQPETDFDAPDVIVRTCDLGCPPPEAERTGPLVAWDAGSARYFWPEVGSVEVRQGREILVDPVENAGPEILSHIVQGMAFGTLLDQRDSYTLHASAVAIDGRVVAFLGWKGHGKSTTCATLYGRGHPFVTDDVLALEGCGEGPVTVLPGTAQIKLYPDSLEASLGESADALPKIWEASPKRFRHVADGLDAALPLAAIYVLDFGTDADPGVRIEPVTGHAAFIELIRHSYMLRFTGEGGATPRHLSRSAWLADHVAIRRLVRPRDVSRVRESAEAVERDVRRLARLPGDGQPDPTAGRTLIVR